MNSDTQIYIILTESNGSEESNLQVEMSIFLATYIARTLYKYLHVVFFNSNAFSLNICAKNP